MKKKTITYIVTTEVSFGDDGDWRRKIREIRSKFKTDINSHPDMKVLKIETKVED
uniref:Uncharacterized protein n=1 Tax=viral metagenome TaxID=1070528 RepID=A0A6M3LE87_9ZZZZ